MAKIVSGNQAPTGLEQFAFFHDLTSKAKARKDEQEQQAFEHQLQFQKLMLAMQQERVKSEQIRNQAAQAGDAKALEELAMRGKQDPSKIMIEDALKLAEKVEDPKMRPRALKAVGELYKEEAKFKKGQAFDQMLTEAEASPNLFPPEKVQDWRQRAATGEQLDTLSKEVMDVRKKAGEEATNMTENQEALMQATQAIQALPKDSYERRDAEVALNAALADEGALKRQGFGAGVLKAVQSAALGAAQGFPERQAALGEWRTRQQAGQKAPGMDMTVGQRNEQMMQEPTGVPFPDFLAGGDYVMQGKNLPAPPTFTGGSHDTLKGLAAGTVKPGKKGKSQRERAIVSGVAQALSRKESPGLWLQSQGIEITPEITELIKGLIQQGSNPDAAPAAE